MTIDLVLCPSIHNLSFFFETFSWLVLDGAYSSFLLPRQIFYDFECSFVIVPVQDVFCFAKLLSYPFLFGFFHAFSDFFVDFPIFIGSSRALLPLFQNSFLSHISSSSVVIQGSISINSTCYGYFVRLVTSSIKTSACRTRLASQSQPLHQSSCELSDLPSGRYSVHVAVDVVILLDLIEMSSSRLG